MKKKLVYGLGAVLFLSVLGFAYYAISPLWRNISLDEALPSEEKTATEVKGGGVGTEEVASLPKRVPILDTVAHPASGYALLVKAGGASYLRYEDLKTINGPDLYVYLSKDLDAKDFVDLGRIKATEGNVNYEIPENINLKDYRYALIWCKAFGVLFNSADLSSLH